MNLANEVTDLRTRGFVHAALYLENPQVTDEFTLDQIIALNAPQSKFANGDGTFSIANQTLTFGEVAGLTVQAANTVNGILENNKPLSLEEAYLIASIHSEEARAAPGTACGFFHAIYFFTPFSQIREPNQLYELPVSLIRTLAEQPETKENYAFAEQIMQRLIVFYNTELKRSELYDKKILMSREKGEAQARLADEVQIDLNGYQGRFLLDGVEPQPYPQDGFRYAMGHAIDVWIRPLYGAHNENASDIIGLARPVPRTDFAKKIAQRFGELVTQTPLQYFESERQENNFKRQIERWALDQ